MYIPIKTMKYFLSEFEQRLQGYSVEKKSTPNGLINIYLLNDSLALLVEIVGRKASLCCNAEEMYGDCRKNPYLGFPIEGETYYTLRIEELTPNDIGFKYSNARFIREMQEITRIPFLSTAISYSRFDSDRKSYWYYTVPGVETDANKRIGVLFPELRLQDRCDAWIGKLYYFIVLEFEDVNGHIHRACAYATAKPHSYIVEICKTWIKTGKLKGTAISTGPVERDMAAAFDSWKGVRRQERLEKHLRYFFVEKHFKNHDDLFWYSQVVLKEANAGKYDYIERSTYLRPVNKWVSEELVYNIAKKCYNKVYPVVYQHRPFFLRSLKDGQMSYDVFISGLNVAIEYQGKQHFEPVEFFCGKESFEDLQARDKLKAKLSAENGIKLVYINYWEEITPDLIIERVGVDMREKNTCTPLGEMHPPLG